MASKTMVHDTNDKVLIAIWVDELVNANDTNRKIQQQLRTIFNCLKTFENRNECEKYIRSTSSQENILLIVSGRFGRELVPDIHQLQHVVSIYVYCQDKKRNEEWANQYKKVKAVITRFDELISHTKTEQENFSSTDKTDQSKIKYTLDQAYCQIVSDVLRLMKPHKNDMKELVALCKDLYREDKHELDIVKEFEKTYSSDKAIYWYTRECFIYKSLDKALHTHDISGIFLFQFFIRDIHRQLAECQCQFKSPVRLYRGQRLLDDDFNYLRKSVGDMFNPNTLFSSSPGFAFANALFSSSPIRAVAIGFINPDSSLSGSQSVLFVIDADPRVVKTKSFGEISEYSYFPNEKEVLFSVDCFFRIIDVQRDDHDQIWIVRVTLCGDNDPDMKRFFQELKQKYGYDSGEGALFAFSRVLRAMKEFDEAEKYCHRLLEDYASDDSSLAILYDELAEIASSKGDYDLKTQWNQKSLKIKKKTGFISHIKSDDGGSNLDDDYASSDIRGMDDSKSTGATVKPSTPDQTQTANNFRFTDVLAEKHDILLPIEGYEKKPLVTLEEAVVPLVPILPDIRRKVHTAKQKCKNPADGLTPDQSAAIMLYTMEWEPYEQCLYVALNACLRAADRKKLKPWFLYLKLVLTGLSRLPSVERTVYRGVKRDLSGEHHDGEQFFWWGFSSCTKTMNVLKSDQFLGNSGIRTFFMIECKNGKDIRHHSYFKKEDEILLLPATFLEVVSCFEMAPGLHAIQLKEIKPQFPYLEPVD